MAEIWAGSSQWQLPVNKNYQSRIFKGDHFGDKQAYTTLIYDKNSGNNDSSSRATPEWLDKPIMDNLNHGMNFNYRTWGHEIVACANGKVVYVDYCDEHRHGLIIIKSGKYFYGYSAYSDNYNQDTFVSVGQFVKKGQLVARMTSDHLHVEIDDTQMETLKSPAFSNDPFLDPEILFGLKENGGN